MTEEKQYPWTDDPTINGVSDCDTDILNDCLMHLKYENTNDAIQNMYMTGQVEKQTRGLLQLCNMSHSTFDRSKFTVVGSPVITDDGIVSGFSSSNYLRIPNLNISGATNFELITGWFSLSDNSLNFIPIINWGSENDGETKIALFYRKTTGNIDLTIYQSATSIGGGSIPSAYVSLNKLFNVKIVYKDTKWNAYYKTTDSDWVQFVTNRQDNTGVTITTQRPIGWKNSAEYLTGSIDLKQFSITVDGVEVFSGNKTGIDTIKPDDYTVVGTPTISADGIASGFSEDNNYVLKTLNLSNALSLRIEFANIYCPRQTTERHKAFFEIQPTSSSSYFGLRFYRNSVITSGLGAVYPTSSGGATVVDLSPSFNTAENFSGYVEIKNNILSFVISDTACGSYELTTEQLAYIFTNVNLSIGATTHNGSGQHLADGSIDLNSFKIYVDGNLVYQPCLKIPYTYAGNGKGYNASTGSKVVQSIYRDRVSDMYEQFGYAPYYTLSESDFTLPMGEIYGYLEKRARDIAHPIAQPFYRFSDEINEDEVRLEGAEVDKGLYLAIEQDPYLSALCTAGSTSNKICLPDFRNRVIYGDVASGYVEPELPDHQHSPLYVGGSNEDLGDPGAYCVTSNTQYNGVQTNTNGYTGNVSNNSIFKTNGTVKTAGVKARWLCRWK